MKEKIVFVWEKKKVRKIDVCLFVIMKTNIEMVFLLELYPCMLFKTDHAVRNRRMQLHRSAQRSHNSEYDSWLVGIIKFGSHF